MLLKFDFSPFSLIGVFSTLLCLTSFNDVAFSFYCTESFCAEQTAPYNSPCQPVSNCTKIGFRKFLDPDTCNCCNYCFDYLEENDICETLTPTKPTKMCGPHLKCEIGERDTDPATCQKMKETADGTREKSCMAKRHAYELAKEKGELGIAQVYPECDAGGLYAPRQCIPGSVCYCSSLSGERIFGMAQPQDYQDCACARDISRLQEFGFSGRLPHCLPNGDYDELQCVVRTCFCRSHPEEKFAMHKLNESKCYNPEIHIFDPTNLRYYMRDCELERARLEVQMADAELEGRKVIIADVPICDPDGNYASVQSKFNKWYCANSKDGSQIENYEAKKFSDEAVDMKCHCARVRASSSGNYRPKCTSNGNYRPWQCIGRNCFCVEELDGSQKLTYPIQVDEDDLEDLPCYPNKVTVTSTTSASTSTTEIP